jgi:hypothetical protein
VIVWGVVLGAASLVLGACAGYLLAARTLRPDTSPSRLIDEWWPGAVARLDTSALPPRSRPVADSALATDDWWRETFRPE